MASTDLSCRVIPKVYNILCNMLRCECDLNAVRKWCARVRAISDDPSQPPRIHIAVLNWMSFTAQTSPQPLDDYKSSLTVLSIPNFSSIHYSHYIHFSKGKHDLVFTPLCHASGLLLQNSMDWRLINNRNVLCPVSESGKSKIKEIAWLGEVLFLVHRCLGIFLLCSHIMEGVRGALWSLFDEGTKNQITSQIPCLQIPS